MIGAGLLMLFVVGLSLSLLRGSPAPRPAKSSFAVLEEILANLADGQLAAAEIGLREYLAAHPDSEAASEELRWLYFNQLRTRDVQEFLEAEFQSHPDQLWLLAELLTTEFRKQLPREGLKYLQDVNARHPGQAPVLLALGYCYWQIGELGEAHAALQSALELRPQHRATRLLVAEYLLEQNEPVAAAALIEESPDVVESAGRLDFAEDDRWWSLKSQLADRRGDLIGAQQDLARALELRPAELQYVQRQGQLLQRLGRMQESAEVLRAANRLEAIHTELSEIVLRGKHEQPTPELCRRLADLCEELHQPLRSDGWRRLAEQLAAPRRAAPAIPARRLAPGGGGPM
jgi:tetratricopeptide (TPR) repeat protein